jgi:large subunit ribosomal protein L24
MAAARSSSRRPTLKIRSGDRVEVISGKDRGKSGRVLRVEPKKSRVVVEGLNMVKRHTRPQQVAGAHTQAAMGGVIEREGSIHVSNVMLLDPKGKRTRVAIEREDGKRVRVAKISGTRLD